jgi:hypothetical protein
MFIEPVLGKQLKVPARRIWFDLIELGIKGRWGGILGFRRVGGVSMVDEAISARAGRRAIGRLGEVGAALC